MRPMSEFAARVTLGLWLVVAGAALLACPKPAPVTPDAADAHVVPASCDVACAHAQLVCSTVDHQTCLAECNRIGQAFAGKLEAASGCPDVKVAGQ